MTLARQVADKSGDGAEERLRGVEESLLHARLDGEDTLCQASLSGVERRWLRQCRSEEAARWNLLTDLDIRSLPYAA